jgi:hypothetical protein
LHEHWQIDWLRGIDMHGRRCDMEVVKIIDKPRVLAELINICVVVVDVRPPWLLVEPGVDALEGSAGINMTTDDHNLRTGLPIRQQCIPYRCWKAASQMTALPWRNKCVTLV